MRQVGKASLFTAVGGVVLPFAAGMAVGSLLEMDLYASMFLAAAAHRHQRQCVGAGVERGRPAAQQSGDRNHGRRHHG